MFLAEKKDIGYQKKGSIFKIFTYLNKTQSGFPIIFCVIYFI